MENYFSEGGQKNGVMAVRVVISAVILFALLFLGSLFATFSNVQAMRLGEVTDVAFGPLVLMQIAKTAGINGEGYVLEFALKSGLAGLFLLSVVVAILAVVTVRRIAGHSLAAKKART
jgi:hypothetical protein